MHIKDFYLINIFQLFDNNYLPLYYIYINYKKNILFSIIILFKSYLIIINYEL